MSTHRRQTESAAEEIVRPILGERGLELFEVTVTGPGRAPALRIVVDRPGGGITVDELSDASQSIEKSLEVSEIFPGRYRLEVSSPGINRPWKTLRDFQNHVGEIAVIKTHHPLAGGQRHVRGRVASVEGDTIHILLDSGESVAIAIPDIASARPEVDWPALLRGGRQPGRNEAGSRGGDEP